MAGKHRSAAYEHENDSDNFPKSPLNTAYRKSVAKHDQSLEDASNAAEFHTASEYLEDLVSGPDHDTVKFAAFYN